MKRRELQRVSRSVRLPGHGQFERSSMPHIQNLMRGKAEFEHVREMLGKERRLGSDGEHAAKQIHVLSDYRGSAV